MYKRKQYKHSKSDKIWNFELNLPNNNTHTEVRVPF